MPIFKTKRLWKFGLLLFVPLALYFYIAERNSWRPKTIVTMNGLEARFVKFSPDGRYLAVETRNSEGGVTPWGDLYIYDVSARTIVCKFSETNFLAFLHPLSTFETNRISVSENRKAQTNVYTLPTLNLVQTRLGRAYRNGLSTSKTEAHSLDDTLRAALDVKPSVIKLYHGKAAEPFREINTTGSPVNSLDFSPDGRTLASAHWDGTVKLWRVK